MEPVVARKTWRTVEPIHGAVYFAPEALENYRSLGLRQMQQGYFATRAAPMGAVSADVVIATFFNFYPALVRAAIPSAWSVVTPEAAVLSRLSAFDRMFRRLLGSVVDPKELAEAATLVRRAAERACDFPEGRPLFAGHASLAWPDEDHLVLWHAQTLLREFRGDGHVAMLAAEGITGCQALVIHAATGEVPAGVLKSTRAWPEEDWALAEDELRARGWIDRDGSFTEAGRVHRQMVEDRTDLLALPAYEAIGEEACARLRELARPWSRSIVESGGLSGR
jgi:hypothetical protein